MVLLLPQQGALNAIGAGRLGLWGIGPGRRISAGSCLAGVAVSGAAESEE
jgi:hypothetical protein